MFVKNQSADAVRLNKYLSDAGFCSRREADRLIEAGKVLIDGQTALQGQKVLPGQQVIAAGQEITREQELVLLAVNKPRGTVCTTDRRWDDTTIYDVVNYPKRVFSIGRLDKDSEGLLLMTNHGDILNKIMRAGNYHEKEYLVTVDRDITQDFLKKMAAGVYLKDLNVVTRPCRVELAGKQQFRIVLTQGLNRQIRRMCEAFHYQVKRLVRTRVMNIELGNLRPGGYRSVTRQELSVLFGQLKDSTNESGNKSQNREQGGTGNKRQNNGKSGTGRRTAPVKKENKIRKTERERKTR